MQERGNPKFKERRPRITKRVGQTPSDTEVEWISVEPSLPVELPLLPIAQSTLFPGMVIPVILEDGKLTSTVERALQEKDYIGVVVVDDSDKSAKGVTSAARQPFQRYGMAARILKKINLPDNQVSVLISGLQRFELVRVTSEEPIFVGTVKYLVEHVEKDTELEALLRSALTQFKALAKDNPLISEEVKVALVNVEGPHRLSDFIASVFLKDIATYQMFLGEPDVKARLHHLLLLLKKEQEVQAVQKHISDEINQKVASTQREYYLQEQLKLIQRELGRTSSDRQGLQNKFRARLKDKNLPGEVKTRLEEEFEKLGILNEQSSEYSVAINYLDWATSLPWGVTDTENLDLKHAEEILDRQHFGLKDVKERILEFLAVKKLKANQEGAILCFVGPPGTGKTSLGKSIAAALNRKFFRFSVGGMRDEAEIKGHRRTYVGALPGKIVQGLKRVGSANPVFLIDEIDKLNHSSISGDPASALLEVLDPEQNGEFLDHYLDMPFDCSKVLFITTANTVDSIPPALLDRMEVIPIHGYTDREKFAIAKRHLLPKQLKKNGLTSKALKISDAMLQHLVARYARESGVRNLEKQLTKICRKVAHRQARAKTGTVSLDSPKVVEKFLGLPPYQAETELEKIPGVSVGLAWTSFGGEVLFVESRAVDGKGGFTLTGSLGEVMQESASIAYTFVRDKSKRLNLEKGYFDKRRIHLHVPAGAIPKDGPSAGVTMAASLYSLIAQKPMKVRAAMTGELSLTGRVLPVGGIKEKLLAAKRAGYRTILLPKRNLRDVKELDEEVKRGLKLRLVDSMDEAIRFLF